MSIEGPALTKRFQEALCYTSALHATQKWKGTDIPYIAHLMAVCALVLEQGGDEDQAIAALLHDAVEDQGGKPTLEEIRYRFGTRVARLVEGCTDADTIPKPPWRRRLQQLHRAFLGPLMGRRVQRVAVETLERLDSHAWIDQHRINLFSANHNIVVLPKRLAVESIRAAVMPKIFNRMTNLPVELQRAGSVFVVDG